MRVGNENMAMVTLFLKEYIRLIRNEIEKDYISLSIVSTADGTVMLYDSKDPSINNRNSGAYQFGIMKSVAMGVKKMGREADRNQDIYDITVSYEGQKHILALSDTRKYMVHLILEDTANIALVKKYMEKVTGKLIKEYASKAGEESIKKVDITTY